MVEEVSTVAVSFTADGRTLTTRVASFDVRPAPSFRRYFSDVIPDALAGGV